MGGNMGLPSNPKAYATMIARESGRQNGASDV